MSFRVGQEKNLRKLRGKLSLVSVFGLHESRQARSRQAQAPPLDAVRPNFATRAQFRDIPLRESRHSARSILRDEVVFDRVRCRGLTRWLVRCRPIDLVFSAL